MVKSRSRDLALLGLMFALVIILTFFPPRLFTVDLAYALLPIFIVAQLRGWKMGLIMGTFYGLMSMTVAFTTSTSILRFVFQNPMVSVLPRMIVGVSAAFFYKVFKALLNREYQPKESVDNAVVFTVVVKKNSAVKDSLTSYLAAVFSVLTNTVFVLGFMLIFYNNRDFEGFIVNFKTIMAIIISTNTLIEVIALPLLTAPIVVALKKAFK